MDEDRAIAPPPEAAAEVNRSSIGRRFAVGLEWCFGAAVVLAIVKLVYGVVVDGYLPDPFLHAKSDSFNDWYNPAYWANNHGAYSEWYSIYPPFCFVLLRLLTRAECYAFAVDSSRECDPTGIVFLTIVTVINFFLVWLVFRKFDKATALPRALAVGLGFPVLYGWERGNLVIPGFTAFILGYGNLLRSARLKAFCVAISLNVKPYLLLASAGRFVKRDWIWLEWSGLWFIAIYAVSYAIIGAGDPITLIRNTIGFEHVPGIDLIGFTTTYTALLTIVKLPLPIIELLGSAPIEAAERFLPLATYAGAAGALACTAYATWRPAILTRGRIAALMLLLIMSVSTAPGGYSLQYALFFLFCEKWSGFGRVVALTCAYLWCIPIDLPLVDIYRDYGFSFLGQRVVRYDLSLTLGQLLRPGLLLLIEYGLIWASAGDVLRDLRDRRRCGGPLPSSSSLAEGGAAGSYAP